MDIAGFSSPVQGGKSAISSAVVKAKELAHYAKVYADEMERGWRAASKAAGLRSGGGGSPVSGGGGTANGGGASIPPTMRVLPPLADIDTPRRGPSSPWRASVNGGGANIPSSQPRSYEETRAASDAMFSAAGGNLKKANGGGASFGGAAKKILGAAGLAALKTGVDPKTYESTDWLANRTALAANGGYDKEKAARYLGGNFKNAFRTDQERFEALSPIIGRGGFSMGSAGMQTQLTGAANVARLNPLLASQAGKIQLEGQDPRIANYSRVLGIETIGRGGVAKTPQDIAKQLARMGWGGRLPSNREIAASLGPAGRLTQQMNAMGLSEGMQTSIGDYLRDSSSKGHFLSNREMASTSASVNPAGDTIEGSRQTVRTAQQDVIDKLVKGYAEGFSDASATSVKALEAFAATLNGPVADALGHAFGLHGGASQTNTGKIITTGAVALGARAAWRHIKSGAKDVGGAVAEEAGPVGRFLGKAGRTLGRVGEVAGVAGLIYNEVTGLATARSQDQKQYSGGADYGGDGPGFSGGAVFPGNGGGSFRGKEWGDNADLNVQNAAAKSRGAQTYQWLEDLMNQPDAPPHRIVSTIRRGSSGVTATGNVSYHATGNAIDIAGPTPVQPGQKGSPALLAINRYLAKKLGAGAAELIYSGTGGTNLWNGQPHKYRDPTYSMHFDHVHVAATLKSLQKAGVGVEDTAVGANSGMSADRQYELSQRKRAANVKAINRASDRRASMGRISQGQGQTYSEKSLIMHLLSGGDKLGGSPVMGGSDIVADKGEVDPQSNGGGKPPAKADRYDIHKLAQLARSVGFHGDGLIDAVSVALAESDGVTKAVNYNDDPHKTIDQGIWQINNYWHSEVKNPFDPVENAKAAYRISSGGTNWNQWATWKHGQARKRMGEVKQTLTPAEIGDGPGMLGGAAYPGVEGGAIHAGRGEHAHVPAPRGTGGRGGVISIAKVEVNLHNVERVSQTEAKRIGRMVIDEIAAESRRKEMSR